MTEDEDEYPLGRPKASRNVMLILAAAIGLVLATCVLVLAQGEATKHTLDTIGLTAVLIIAEVVLIKTLLHKKPETKAILRKNMLTAKDRNIPLNEIESAELRGPVPAGDRPLPYMMGISHFDCSLIPHIRLSRRQETFSMVFEEIADSYRFINRLREHMKAAGIQIKEEGFTDIFGKKQVTKIINLDLQKH